MRRPCGASYRSDGPELDGRIAVLCKTNLLEAIFVIASLRSFRTAKLADLIAFGAVSAKYRQS